MLPGVDGLPEQIRLATVTTNFFRLLGHRVVLGRDFQDTDGIPQSLSSTPQPGRGDCTTTSQHYRCLIHEYWQRRYGGDRTVIKLLDSLPAPGPDVVGVLAPGLELLLPPGDKP